MSTFFYRKLGKGYPVILIHGFCETHEIWNGFAETLSEKFEVFTIDLPGFGASPLPLTSFSLDDVAVKIFEWISERKIEKPLIVGHSLGGYVALAMGKRHPEKFAGIVLFQSTAYPDSEEKKANRNKVIEFVKAHGTDPYIDTFVPGLFFDKKHPAISIVDSIARKTSKETLLAYTEAMRDRPSSIDFFKNYKKTILILSGHQDTIITAEAAQEHGTLNQNATVHLFENTGHMAMYERPRESERIVEAFAMKTFSKISN